jgi:lysophospholipase L1-like esterase
MGKLRKTIAVLPAAAIGMAYAQIRRAAHRPDLPSFPNQDPSGTFGQPGLTPLRIVALGDSSITAPGVEDLDNMWLRRIARTLSSDYSVELISVAVGGSKARDVRNNQLDAATELKPDIAVISVGANDAIRATPVYRYRNEMHSIVAELHAASGAVFVLGLGDLGSIPRLPPILRSGLSRRAARFDAAAWAVAARFPKAVKGPTSGPMSTAFWKDRELFAGDLFHAGDRGHGVFAEQALPAIRAALAISRPASRQHEPQHRPTSS